MYIRIMHTCIDGYDLIDLEGPPLVTIEMISYWLLQVLFLKCFPLCGKMFRNSLISIVVLHVILSVAYRT